MVGLELMVILTVNKVSHECLYTSVQVLSVKQTRQDSDWCVVAGGVAQLVFSSSEGLRLVSTAGSEYRELSPGSLGPGAMAVFAANHTLYWAGLGKGSVYRYYTL